MDATVAFAPASISFPVTQVGAVETASTSSGGLPATANVSARIAGDTSGGALTVSSIQSFIIESEVETPGPGDGPSGGHLKPVKIPVAEYLGSSENGNPLNVLAGQSVQVNLRFAPTAATPYNCAATLVVTGDTWSEPIQVPLAAVVGEVQVSVPAMTVVQDQTKSAPVTIGLSSGPDVTVSLALEAYSSLSPVGILSIDESPAAVSSAPPVSATRELTASGGLAPGDYAFYLVVSVVGANAYTFSVPISLAVVAPYYVIKSKLGNVIDVRDASTALGAGLDAFPQNDPVSDNQLWTFIPDPAGSGYYFIASKLNGNVIDIKGASTAPGTLLDAYSQKPAGTDNQLWCFVADPLGSGYCFIVSKLNSNAIDIQNASTAPGTALDAFPVKLTQYENQLWTVVGGTFPAILDPVPPAPSGPGLFGGLAGGNVNYFIYAQDEALTGVSVSVRFTSDFTSDANGYSFQVNCDSTPGSEITTFWQQFVIRATAGSNQLIANITTWTAGAAGGVFFYQDVPFATLPSATIPQGYTFTIALNYLPDQDGYLGLSTALVCGATFTVTDAGGNAAGNTTITIIGNAGELLSQPATVANLAPVGALQLNIGASGRNLPATLAQGAGEIRYAASVGVGAVGPKPTADLNVADSINFTTGETANIVFGPLPWPFSASMASAEPALAIVQLFEVTPK
jgi:hypothetical protein